MTIYAEAVAPEGFEVVITPGDSGLDLSTVSAAEFSVLNAERAEVTWAATISDQTATSLTLTHTFQVGDVPTRGAYIAVPVLTVPGGTHRCARVTLNVQDQYRG